MADVTLTAALRSNLLSLQGTQKLLDSTQLKLATGKKVNSALDNAASFFASQSLTNRASDLSGLLDGIGQGIQALKAADNGITAMTNLLNQAKAIAQEARDGASTSASMTTSNIAGANLKDITDAGGMNIGDGDAFSIQLGPNGVNHTITIGTGDSMQDVVDQLNSIDGVSAKLVKGNDPNDPTARKLEIRTSDDIIIDDADGALVKMGFTLPTDTEATVYGGTGTRVVQQATNEAPSDQAQLESDFAEILTQIGDITEDASYRGTNLLKGDSLEVKFNEDGSSNLNISGVTFDAAGLGVSAADFGTVSDIDNTITQITNALDTVRAQSRTFGNNLTVIQNREDFTSSIINTLKEGSDKLTLADQNEEGAKLLALQTQQSLGVTSLSLASQASQSVLRLFG